MQSQKERYSGERKEDCGHQGKAEMIIFPRKCEMVLLCCHSVIKGTYQWERLGKVLGNFLIIPIDFCIV